MSSDLIIARPPSPHNPDQSYCIASSFRTLPNRYQAVKPQSAKRALTPSKHACGPIAEEAADCLNREAEHAPTVLALGFPVDDLQAFRNAALLLEVLDRLRLAAQLVNQLEG